MSANWNGRLKFSIAGLMIFTAMIAVHCAFPTLLWAHALALMVAITLFELLYVPVFVAAAIVKEVKNSRLAVEENPFVRFISIAFQVIVFLAWTVCSIVAVIIDIYGVEK